MLVERMRDSLQAAGGWAALQPEQGRQRPDGGSRREAGCSANRGPRWLESGGGGTFSHTMHE